MDLAISHPATTSHPQLTIDPEFQRQLIPLSAVEFAHLEQSIIREGQLPDSRRNKFHKFRRTTASNFEAAGGNATKLLDHRKRATTAKYLDPRVIKKVMPADIVPGIGETEVSTDHTGCTGRQA